MWTCDLCGSEKVQQNGDPRGGPPEGKKGKQRQIKSIKRSEGGVPGKTEKNPFWGPRTPGT